MKQRELSDDPTLWAATGRVLARMEPNPQAMAETTKMHGLDGVRPTPAGYEEAQGYIAVIMRGSISPRGFDDLLGPRKHLGECSTYLTCAQAVQMAGRLMASVAEAQRRLAEKRLKMGDES